MGGKHFPASEMGRRLYPRLLWRWGLGLPDRPSPAGEEVTRECVQEPPQSQPSLGCSCPGSAAGGTPTSTLEQGVPEIVPGCWGRPKSEQMCSGGALGVAKKEDDRA